MLNIGGGVDRLERVSGLQAELEELVKARERISGIMAKQDLPVHEKKNCRASLLRLDLEIERICILIRSKSGLL